MHKFISYWKNDRSPLEQEFLQSLQLHGWVHACKCASLPQMCRGHSGIIPIYEARTAAD